ncbi:hypothetical protein [Kitasatospora sp. NBC_01302]|uniref:hypothetical protein n=1 Tax=Kitasatospora sp. NBC_01302 TaxID=2903575 RepID=UPI002E120EE1|nr:hypothetical protein OG294_24525 [Kitasatospora sp. NBC_01302]
MTDLFEHVQLDSEKEPLPATGRPHWLVVEGTDSDHWLYTEHAADCLDRRGELRCDVAFHEEEGLDCWFHRDGIDEGHYGSVGLRPGRYLIEAWSSRSYCHYYGTYEYDGGLALLHPEVAE